MFVNQKSPALSNSVDDVAEPTFRKEAELDKEDLEIFVTDDSTACECLQIAPILGGKVAILFLLSSPDYVTTISVIFIVNGFEPESAHGLLVTSEWLMSLSASPSGELFALEATTWIWRFAGGKRSRDKISNESLRRIWAKDPGGPIAIGSEGQAYQLVSELWQPIPSIAPIQYFDVHGRVGHGIVACGDQGTLHRLADGGHWQSIELHRGDQFRGVDLSSNGVIRLAGDNGVCIKLENDELTQLIGSELTYFAVRSYKSHSYWGDEVGVYIEKDGELEPLMETGIASDLRSDEDFLYVSGTDTAWRFDGAKWKTLTLIYDDGFKLDGETF